jgi:hypothetical protein
MDDIKLWDVLKAWPHIVNQINPAYAHTIIKKNYYCGSSNIAQEPL